jgi:hypothetical protein
LKPKENVPDEHTEYFEGKKRFKHIVVQGQFKEKMKMSDAWIGEVYEKPMIMPKWVAKLIMPFFQRIAPGLFMDFTSENNHKV